MRLIGSAVEEDYKRELKEGAQHLLEGGGDPRLLDLLHREIGVIESAYFLSGYKLSDYHICRLLVNGAIIFHIELSEGQIEAFNTISVSQYKRGLKRKDQIKLQVALELAALK